jgi:SWIM zinc finger
MLHSERELDMNINLAVQQANRYERAKTLLKEGYTFHKDQGSDVVAVCKPGRLAASYWLNMLSEGCDCPDFLKRGQPCKHMLAWDILEAKAMEEAGLEAQCAEYEWRAENEMW